MPNPLIPLYSRATRPAMTFPEAQTQQFVLQGLERRGQADQLKQQQEQQAFQDQQKIRQVLASGLPDDQTVQQLRMLGLGDAAFAYEQSAAKRNEEIANASKEQRAQHLADLTQTGQFLNALRQLPEGSPQRASAWYQYRSGHKEAQNMPDTMSNSDIELAVGQITPVLTQLQMANQKAESEQKTQLYPFQLREAQAKATTAEQAVTGTQPITPYQRAELDKTAPRNIDPNSPEGMNARLLFERQKAALNQTEFEKRLNLFRSDPETYKAMYGTKDTNEKPATAAERRVMSFFLRAQDADQTTQAIEPEIQKMGIFDVGRMKWAPNALQSETGQSYVQAQRAFTEARLRKDSGAAIPPHEYENDAKTYFAQPGDSAKTLEQKRRGRQTVLNALKQESGRAYSEYFGESNQRGGMIRVMINGAMGEIPADQLDAARKKYPKLQVIQ